MAAKHKITTAIDRSHGASFPEPTTPATVARTIDIAAMAQFGFPDALIVACAEQAEATHLCSEELNAGPAIAGVKIVNPLVAL